MALTTGIQRGTIFLIALGITLAVLTIHPVVMTDSSASIDDLAAREDRVVLWSYPSAAPGDRVAYRYIGLHVDQLFEGMDLYVTGPGGHSDLLNGTEPDRVYLHREHPGYGDPSGGNRTLGAEGDGGDGGADATDGGDAEVGPGRSPVSGPAPWVSFTAPGPADQRGFSPIEVVWVLHARDGGPLYTDAREKALVEGWLDDLSSETVDGTTTYALSVRLEPWLVGLEATALVATAVASGWLVAGLVRPGRHDKDEEAAGELESLVRLADRGHVYLSSLRNALGACLLAVVMAAVFATAYWTEVSRQLFLAPQTTLWDDFIVRFLLAVWLLSVAVLAGLLFFVQRELARWEDARERGRLEV